MGRDILRIERGEKYTYMFENYYGEVVGEEYLSRTKIRKSWQRTYDAEFESMINKTRERNKDAKIVVKNDEVDNNGK